MDHRGPGAPGPRAQQEVGRGDVQRVPGSPSCSEVSEFPWTFLRTSWENVDLLPDLRWWSGWEAPQQYCRSLRSPCRVACRTPSAGQRSTHATTPVTSRALEVVRSARSDVGPPPHLIRLTTIDAITSPGEKRPESEVERVDHRARSTLLR